MSNKPFLSVADQILLLRSRGMEILDETEASQFLSNVSYYRLKGYWWDMQSDRALHVFKPGSKFETVLDYYAFDRRLRRILFDAIERIEIALRTKMIYNLSERYGGLWYRNTSLFDSAQNHSAWLTKLTEEFERSSEIFVADHRQRLAVFQPDCWKILEITSLGLLSKGYKNLRHQLPEKAAIAKQMGLNIHSDLSSWLESLSYIRNIVAHHSQLWNRSMVKKPLLPRSTQNKWLQLPITDVQKKKPFLIISTMLYLCNEVSPNNQVKKRIKDLISTSPNIPIYKMGFFNRWDEQELWK